MTDNLTYPDANHPTNHARSIITRSTQSTNQNPREQLAKLGKNLPLPVYSLIQAYLTWQIGKPYAGQQPLFRSTKEWELANSIFCLVVSGIVSSLICDASPLLLPLLIPSWFVSVGSARKMLTCLIHRCVHRQFYGDKRDLILAEVLSTCILVQGFDAYRADHVLAHHHVDKFATWEGDPDAKFMLALGLRPGLK